MTSKPLGPGPGAYALPPTVGYEKHDNRKLRLPQYSFGQRTKLPGSNLGPGPGAYKVDKLTRYGVSAGNQYSMAARTFVKDSSNIGPGPAGHEVHLRPHFKGVNAPAYSMSWRHNYAFKNCAPGPNAYMVNVSKIRPGIPAYSMGLRTGLHDKPKSPGPAAYGLGRTSVNKPKSPEYSMVARNMFNYKQYGPGSNYYNLMEYKPGKTGPGYSFGLRHSEYAPPMIVKCDNI